MLTGDDVAIGREIACQLGMGTHIQPADRLFGGTGETMHLSHDAALLWLYSEKRR